MDIQPVAYICKPDKTRSDVDGARSVVFEGRYRDPNAVRGIEGFSHLWVLWGEPGMEDDESGDGRVQLACVSLAGVRKASGLGSVLDIVAGELEVGTPVYDIKPYIIMSDAFDEEQG